jgi:hypothetical protein
MGLRERLLGTPGARTPVLPNLANVRDRMFGLPKYNRPAPEPNEMTAFSTPAALVTARGRPVVGGVLDATNEGLIFSPVDTSAPRRILVGMARAGGVTGAGVANRIFERTPAVQPQRIPWSDVTSVHPGTGPGILSPPTLEVERTGADVLRVGVVHDPWAPNRSAANTTNRDLAIQQALERIGP